MFHVSPDFLGGTLAASRPHGLASEAYARLIAIAAS